MDPNGQSRISTVVLVALIVGSCSPGEVAPVAPSPPADPDDPEDTNDLSPCEAMIRGFSLSPEGFPADYSALPAFLEEIDDGAIMWNGAWRDDVESGSDSGTIPAAAAALEDARSDYPVTPLAVFGWRSGATLYLNVPGDETNNWSNATARTLFLAMLETFADTYKPPYLFLGNENDFYFEQNPDDYANWIEFYNEAYDAIHAASPDTEVGPVFNFEHLTGLGALAGWSGDAQWDALDLHDFDKLDVIGLTVYPFLEYEHVADVPNDYLEPLFDEIDDVPVVITETGWPAENLGDLNPPWETSENAQVEYVSKFFSMLEDRDVPIVTWLFLNEMVDTGSASTDWKIYGSISLKDADGGERKAYGDFVACGE